MTDHKKLLLYLKNHFFFFANRLGETPWHFYNFYIFLYIKERLSIAIIVAQIKGFFIKF